MKSGYFVEIPFVRAIACLMIVFVHVTAVAYSRTEGFSYGPNLFVNQFSRLGTPVFAVISAFLLFSSVKKRGFKLRQFLLSRTSKVVAPFAVWTIVYLTVDWFAGEVVLGGRQMAGYFVLGTGYYHLYFMVTVIQFYIFFR
ncbi:hypothetical protein JNUCC1_00825 [Lentibacillus sp. JNUCC-1]|nr:hypothetical protein [Lentibacillus sp. JNUCC-1]